MPLNIATVKNVLSEALSGSKKLAQSFKNTKQGADVIYDWAKNNNYKLTSYKDAKSLTANTATLFDDYQNRGFNSFKQSVEKQLGGLSAEEADYLAKEEKQKLWNTDWNGKKSEAKKHRDKYVEKFKKDRYDAHQLELKAGNNMGGGFTGSELDDAYESIVGQKTPASNYYQYVQQQNDESFSAIYASMSQNERVRLKTNDLNKAIAEDAETINPMPLTKQEQVAQDLAYAEAADYANTMPLEAVRAGYTGPGKYRQIPLEESNTNDFNRIFSNMGNNKESVVNNLKQELGQSETPWSSTAKAALGTAVVGAGICAALSSSRGQQNNAQLYGQQPLY